MSRGKQLRLEMLKEQLSNAEEDYKNVKAKLLPNMDPLQERPLQQQLKQLGEKIDCLEAEIATLTEELQGEIRQAQRNRVLQQEEHLLQLLDSYPDELPKIKSSYHSTLVHRKARGNSRETIQDMFKELQTLPPGDFEYSVTAEWIGRIFCLVDSVALRQGIDDWAQDYFQDSPDQGEWDSLKQRIQELLLEEERSLHPALLITIEPVQNPTTTQDTSENQAQYRVKVWFIRNTETPTYEPLGQKDRSGNLLTGDETYLMEAGIPEYLSQCLEECTEMCGEEMPTLHVFLPWKLLSFQTPEGEKARVDRWSLAGGGLVGQTYPVVFRCLDRLSRSYREKPLWRKKWGTQQDFITHQAKAIDVFQEGHDRDNDALDAVFDLLDKPEVVALKAAYPPQPYADDSLLMAIKESGTPIALWGCRIVGNPCNSKVLSDLLEPNPPESEQSACLLQKVPERIGDVRRKSRRKKPPEEHIGHHLVLIWDDPTLVPPKSA